MSKPPDLPKPTFLNQSGKVFIVTGANTGLVAEGLPRAGGSRGRACCLPARDKAESAMARIGEAAPKADLAFYRSTRRTLRASGPQPNWPQKTASMPSSTWA